MKRAIAAAASVLAVAAFALAGCETATPYQPVTVAHAGERGGYSDQQIESNRWRIVFSGNSLTSRPTVERYLLFRAAQLTVNNGFDWFQAVSRHTDRDVDFYGDDFGPGWGPGWGWGPGFGYGGFGGFGPYGGFGYGGFGYGGWGGGGFDIDEVSRYQASTEIVMGHGPKPANNPRAYDAHEVIAHLQGAIKYPKTR